MLIRKISIISLLFIFGISGITDPLQVRAEKNGATSAITQTSGLNLKPVLTAQDAGFFDLITFRGAIYGGTYHDDGAPALIYRIENDVSESTIEARVEGAESIYVFATDRDQTTLILNTERAVGDGQQTAWVRNNANTHWRRINDESSWRFGLGAGNGLGRLWVGNNDGSVWYSEDHGQTWLAGPPMPKDMTATGFIEFNGKLYAGQLDWGKGDSHLLRLNADKTAWEQVILPTPPDGKRWWTILSKRGIAWNGYLYMPGDYTNSNHNGSDGWAKILRMDKDETFEIVCDVESGFFQELTAVRMNDGVERLVSSWSNLWSDQANGQHSRLYGTTNGTDWERYADFDEPFAWGVTSRGGNELFVGTMGVRNTEIKGKIYYQCFDIP